MEKRLGKIALLGSILFVFVLFSCSVELKKPDYREPTKAFGSIIGQAIYSNSEDSYGIIITLDKSDGLFTENTRRAVSARSITDSSRSVVSNTITSSDGSYSFENLEEGLYTIYASSNSSTQKAVCTNVIVRSAQTTYADLLQLTATGSISGSIWIDNTSTGNMGVLVFVAGTSYMAMTDDEGDYTISGVPAGSGYQLVTSKNGVVHNVQDDVVVYANENTYIPTFFSSSDDFRTGMRWRGSCASADDIEAPQYLDAYFNTTDGCSYIYNGSSWEKLAEKGSKGEGGNDGVSINWRGEYDNPNQISNPQNLDAYYNTTDGCSYIYNGIYWNKLSSKGDDGNDGKSINWRGEYDNSDQISNPQNLDTYYNTTDGCAYIYDGYNWNKLSSKGDNGKSINWRGSFEYESSVLNPQELDAYYNTKWGCSYIYVNSTWYKMSEQGQSIRWRGSYSDANSVSDPKYLDVYFNTTTGCAYIFDAYGYWSKISAKGSDGKNGKDGINGSFMRWRGSFANPNNISNPQYLDAYYNTTNGCSYIYNGNSWDLLARSGIDGASGSENGGIRWRGTFSKAHEVISPQSLDAYFNTTDGCSYIFNGTQWQLLAQSGNDGISINWLGSFVNSTSIYDPKYLDAYFNTTENCAYIYNGSSWEVLAKGPGTGGSENPFTGSEIGANVVGTTLVSWDNPTGVIRIPNGVKDISPGVFRNKDNITSVIIPSSVENIGSSAFYHCDKLTNVQFLGNGLKIIGESAFSSCDNLVSIAFPTTLTTIGQQAFYDCSKLTGMELPDGLLSIGYAAFYGCSTISKVNIPDSVVSIGSDAYYACRLLRDLTFGSGITNLEGALSFAYCTSLTNVTIPDNITKISTSIFYSCDSLMSVTVSGTWNDGKTLTADKLKSGSTSYCYRD